MTRKGQWDLAGHGTGWDGTGGVAGRVTNFPVGRQPSSSWTCSLPLQSPLPSPTLHTHAPKLQNQCKGYVFVITGRGAGEGGRAAAPSAAVQCGPRVRPAMASQAHARINSSYCRASTWRACVRTSLPAVSGFSPHNDAWSFPGRQAHAEWIQGSLQRCKAVLNGNLASHHAQGTTAAAAYSWGHCSQQR